MSLFHGRLKGRKWSVWTEELGPGSPPGDTGRGIPSPRPHADDVMKLSREDMVTFGQCPSHDRFFVVKCEKCGQIVKLEAYESHLTLRHGSKSERNAYNKNLATKAAMALKCCQVKLTSSRNLNEDSLDGKPSHLMMDRPLETFHVSGSSSSTSPQPVSYPSSSPTAYPTPSQSLSTSPVPNQCGTTVQPADSASAPFTPSTSPISRQPSPKEEEMMDVDEDKVMDDGLEDMDTLKTHPDVSSLASSITVDNNASRDVSNYVGEEADSTTHNVISIPDTEDIPNIEIGIISGGEVMDSINTKYNVSLMKSESSVDSTTTPVSSASLPDASPRMDIVPNPPPPPKVMLPLNPLPPSAVNLNDTRPNPLTASLVKTSLSGNANNAIKLALGTVNSAGNFINTSVVTSNITTNSMITVNNAQSGLVPLNVRNPAPLPVEKMDTDGPPANAPTHYISVSPLSKSSPKKPAPTSVKNLFEKKPTGREREYDPNKHCGVWDADAKRNCTRSLTCKTHSIFLKRKVLNRSGSFDELLAAHKAEKDNAIKIAEAVPKMEVDRHPILAGRLAPTANTIPTEAPETLRQNSVLKPAIVKKNNVHINVPSRDVVCDENLQYSSEHPKPLAVCTFGGKRIGGLFIADRSRLFSRKVMKIAMSSNGIPRLQPVVRSEAPTVVKRISVPATTRQQTLPYIVNIQGSGAGVTRTVSLPANSRVGTLQIAPGGTIQGPHFVVQDAFKTDIQDFKGGIKFQLGRNIQQILPSADAGGAS